MVGCPYLCCAACDAVVRRTLRDTDTKDERRRKRIAVTYAFP
eukprot:gene37453-52585_t